MQEDLTQDILDQKWRAQEWRLNHLYWIEQKNAPPCRFVMNWAQKEFFAGMHTRNNILKARQLGMSTLTALLILDNCLFNANFHAAIVDKTLEDAKEKIRKIAFAINALTEPPDGETDSSLAKFCRLVASSMAPQVTATKITFANGSDVRASATFRGGTIQFLHISEFGHMANNFPQRAREVISGSLNSVPANGTIVMESTHEGGKTGENYRMTKQAMNKVGKRLLPLDYKFFFFPWWKQPEYRAKSDEPLTLDTEMRDYFALLSTEGIQLDDEQKRWYAAQNAVFGGMTKQEYPSTPEEAFETAVEGSIYGSIITRLRAAGLMAGIFEPEDDKPLYVSWDIGMSDNMAIWLVQPSASGKFLVLDYHTANNKDLNHYVGIIRSWEGLYGQAIASHFLPHDAAQRDKATGISFQQNFAARGLPSRIVPRVSDVWLGIDITRKILRHCAFHARCSEPVTVDGVEYMSGVNALENYQTAPLGKNGVERRTPLHNACSHAADAFRTFAQAWQVGFVGKDTVTPPRKMSKAAKLARSRGVALGTPWGR